MAATFRPLLSLGADQGDPGDATSLMHAAPWRLTQDGRPKPPVGGRPRDRDRTPRSTSHTRGPRAASTASARNESQHARGSDEEAPQPAAEAGGGTESTGQGALRPSHHMQGPGGLCHDPLGLQQHQALWLQILELVGEPGGSQLREQAAEARGCQLSSEEEGEPGPVTIGVLRPGLVRLLWTASTRLLPRVIQVLLSLRGKPCEDQAGVQSVARELQESIPTQEQTDMETSLFTSWTDTVDCGLLQEVLKLLASNQRRRQMLEAAQRIKETRRKQAEKPVGGRQLWLGPGSCQVRWRRQRHGARMRSHAPSTLVNNYWAAMLDAVMEEVPPEILRRVAAQTAAVYNRVHEDVTPSHLLALRIALRERATAADRDRSARQEQAGEREQNSTEESGARGEGSMEEEEEQQEPPKLSARTHRQLSTIPHAGEEEAKERPEGAAEEEPRLADTAAQETGPNTAPKEENAQTDTAGTGGHGTHQHWRDRTGDERSKSDDANRNPEKSSSRRRPRQGHRQTGRLAAVVASEPGK